MKLATFLINGKQHVGALTEQGLRPFAAGPASDIADVIRLQADGVRLRDIVAMALPPVDPASVTFLPPLLNPPKIICVGLNYADHTKESPYAQPDYPTLFLRVATSLIGEGAVLERPLCSDSLDFEGELAVVL
ncbi:MAG TPA: fumarylacetoacetate hydrolase family protein, partial [Albitalea sp.]|nr:fumarylacetoacetate hydrolase family protein [Albitalea sp.]